MSLTDAAVEKPPIAWSPRARDERFDMKRLTTTQLRRKPREGERIVMVTCYDATFARLVDEAGVDAILVGDSLGMVIQGHENTLPVTLDEVIYHFRAVARGSVRPHPARGR